ncbi:hypothetical protein JAK25_10295 [Stenotrophomonas maltophilia]|uniref:hypothetical protein n=1 Tax=Stenotrophomonas maltophilia TaxID=40324 RepID=UPI0021C77CFF|nr:hypothetical protein [Stenotrophomonas maltophilia]MCU1204281.1 hypothetical protein [Stenotrophomonas maltophilia]
MTNDNKTLADVQPGGRVRLGDQASAQGCDELRMRTDGERAAYLEGVAEGRRAVLSAQPSPGGQEVLETVEELAELNRTCAALDPDYKGPTDAAVQAVITALAARQPVVVDLPESLHDRVEALREVAARQPVGEPVCFISPIDASQLRSKDKTLRWTGTYWDRPGDDAVPVYLGPPAQAVDLGPVRDVFRRWHANELNSTDAMLALVEALAVIDSQAVGNG